MTDNKTINATTGERRVNIASRLSIFRFKTTVALSMLSVLALNHTARAAATIPSAEIELQMFSDDVIPDGAVEVSPQELPKISGVKAWRHNGRLIIQTPKPLSGTSPGFDQSMSNRGHPTLSLFTGPVRFPDGHILAP
ncbi:hypothetical protein AA23498_2656 [Acetobacter nitrogenifigens DSM 23921 = NBRC 105050]|uniref:Uncharacterized protein n=1 Tax=Acetobacter nitrogenifigens DSM 23921 = NBRC 105050 TaxID=1120919 RepID=A0A511XFC1_9PROT|nr:hypothetical protein [Acetobacter nitrogenifigens]GBQ96508.1 hypothetical protein AA23498_2656 [Acetobacter nitrogenifigens DSM 23921 = NBRC 105050]GEN61653.1 hypothetical protein ANI02nite_35370 [Acetobacter nitrogenifigens DSM 23921 = NBRC 105050]